MCVSVCVCARARARARCCCLQAHCLLSSGQSQLPGCQLSRLTALVAALSAADFLTASAHAAAAGISCMPTCTVLDAGAQRVLQVCRLRGRGQLHAQSGLPGLLCHQCRRAARHPRRFQTSNQARRLTSCLSSPLRSSFHCTAAEASNLKLARAQRECRSRSICRNAC